MTAEQTAKKLITDEAYLVPMTDDYGYDIDIALLERCITSAIQSALDEQRQQIITFLESAAKREDRLGYIATRNSLYSVLDEFKMEV